jgi:hypothetical protein
MMATGTYRELPNGWGELTLEDPEPERPLPDLRGLFHEVIGALLALDNDGVTGRERPLYAALSVALHEIGSVTRVDLGTGEFLAGHGGPRFCCSQCYPNWPDASKIVDEELDVGTLDLSSFSLKERRGDWQRMSRWARPFLLRHFGRKCAQCGSREEPLHIDHIIPLARGGTNDALNLEVLCKTCNLRKGSSLS